MQIDKIDLSRVNINDVDNKITSLANVAAKTNIANTFNANQTITGQLLLNGNISNPLKIQRDGDTWFGWYGANGTTRRAYFGFPTSGTNMELKNEINNGNIDISLTGLNAKIKLNGTTEISGALTARNAVEFGTTIKMGYGGNPTIQPDDASSKTLNFQRFDLNIGGKKITNVATPTANNDVATKQYVDNNAVRINKVVLNQQTINQGTEKVLFTPNANQSIIGINVYRKTTTNKWLMISSSPTSVEIKRDMTNGRVSIIPVASDISYTNEFYAEIYYI